MRLENGKRTLLYVFRSPKTRGRSIERVFSSIEPYVRLKYSVDVAFLPFPSSSLLYLVLNSLWFSWISLKYDVVHLTGDAHYVLFFSLRRNVVLTIHDCVILSRGKGLKRRILKYLWITMPIRKARCLTTISQSTIDELKDNGCNVDSVVEISNPISDDFSVVSIQDEYVQMPVILHIGTKANKNLPGVMKALKGIECRLIVVGAGTPELENEAKSNDLNVTFLTGVNDVEIVGLYNECNVVSFPSLYEGFGMPIIEGQAAGRVVVTSNQEPMKSVSGGAAIYVDPTSIESIRNGFMMAILDADLRRDLLQKGLLNVSRFRAEYISELYVKIYDRV